KRTKKLQEEGMPGGESVEVGLALYQLSLARAQLATAQGNLAEVVRQCEEAVEAADTVVKSQETRYQSGRVNLKGLLEAQAEMGKAKLALIEAKEKLASQKR